MAEALPEYPDSDFSDDEQSPLDISFNQASEHVRKITSNLDNNKLLELYGLYKQSVEGACKTPRPGWFDGKGRKKWDAWNALGDMPCEDAKQKYIELVQKFDPDYELLTQSGPRQQWAAVSSLQRSPEPELADNDLTLLDAARDDLGTLVTELITKNPDIKLQRDEDGLTALHWAADRDSTLALEAALKEGCDVNAVDNSGQTPLHYAASCGHINSTRILINAGANKLLKDDEDCSPLDLAADDEIRKILSIEV